MPQRLDHNTGCWERGGTATTPGRVGVASCLWLEDLTVSDMTGARRWELCSSCPGNWTVAAAGSCFLLYGQVKQPENMRPKEECVSKIAAHSLC